MHEKLVIVPKKKTGSKKMLTTAWFILACLMFLLATFVNPVIFLIPGIAFALVWYFQAFRSDIEYEYTYYDGEFRFARIKAKSRRKAIGSVQMDDVLGFAPRGDRSVYKYENDKNLAYKNLTSGDPEAKVYELIAKGEKGGKISAFRGKISGETQTEEEMLELRNITYEVEDNQDNKEILKDVSLTIDEHFVAITGPNGGGKSTLAKIIAGIIKPTSGQIILDGEDITELDITERAKHGISYAFQQPVHFKGLTVKDLITIAAGRTMTVNEICEILSEVGLCAREYIDREINGSLSGGELKRIEIAMITARGTKLSIFDEPEAGIDLWSFNSLIKVFEKMRDEIQGTILIISHQERILDIADKIVVIANGQVKTIGTKEEVLPELLHTAGACETLTSKL